MVRLNATRYPVRIRCALVAVVLLSFPPLEAAAQGGAAAHDEAAPLVVYEAGRGLRIDRYGLRLAGYSSLELVREEGGPLEVGWDEASLLINWQALERLRLFAEPEVEGVAFANTDGDQGLGRFEVERLYGDYEYSDLVNLRYGKFLTPVGRWNVVHAPHLVWTTRRPRTTRAFFDQHTTGAMLFGKVFSAAGRLNYSLFGQFADSLEPVEQPVNADRSAGGRLQWTASNQVSLGANYLTFRDDGGWQQLAGVDFAWRQDDWEALGESSVTKLEGASSLRWGAYGQVARRLFESTWGIGRFEQFDPGTEPSVRLVTLGLARRWAALVLKAEYSITDHRVPYAPGGFEASAALVF